jgi:hypothetical protein
MMLFSLHEFLARNTMADSVSATLGNSRRRDKLSFLKSSGSLGAGPAELGGMQQPAPGQNETRVDPESSLEFLEHLTNATNCWTSRDHVEHGHRQRGSRLQPFTLY